MPTINQLTATDTLASGDSLPVYVASQGDARRASLTTLISYLATAFEYLGVSSYLKTTPCLVAQLPSAATSGAGARAFVTDASATTFASTVSGGGSSKVPVYSDGSNWKIG